MKLAEHYTHSGEVQQTLTICMDYVTEKYWKCKIVTHKFKTIQEKWGQGKKSYKTYFNM